MIGEPLACPFCWAIFVSDVEEGDECPECGVGDIITLEEHMNVLSTSFGDAMDQYRGENV